MKVVNKVFALAAVIAVAACTGASYNNTVEALNQAEAIGSPFTKHLAAEYRAYANNAQHRIRDYTDATHFARKGLAAASGVVVMPEVLDDWDLSDANLQEMVGARAALVDALEAGGREIAPELSAIAQTRFDCWSEQQEENWTANVPCKNEFYAALKDLQAQVGPRTPPVPPAPPAPAFPEPIREVPKEPVPVEQAMFIVFFDWDKSTLTQGANDVLDAVAQEVRNRQDVRSIVVVGHTDSSGNTAYNDKLSLRRANAIRDGLAQRGIDRNAIRVEGRGENDLLVQTGDNVREPANRRGQITLE